MGGNEGKADVLGKRMRVLFRDFGCGFPIGFSDAVFGFGTRIELVGSHWLEVVLHNIQNICWTDNYTDMQTALLLVHERFELCISGVRIYARACTPQVSGARIVVFASRFGVYQERV